MAQQTENKGVDWGALFSGGLQFVGAIIQEQARQDEAERERKAAAAERQRIQNERDWQDIKNSASVGWDIGWKIGEQLEQNRQAEAARKAAEAEQKAAAAAAQRKTRRDCLAYNVQNNSGWCRFNSFGVSAADIARNIRNCDRACEKVVYHAGTAVMAQGYYEVFDGAGKVVLYGGDRTCKGGGAKTYSITWKS